MSDSSDQALADTVFRVLTDIAPEIEPEDVAPDTDLREELDLDSMDFLNFVIALHEELEVDIPETDYPRLATMAGCVAYLRRKLADGSG